MVYLSMKGLLDYRFVVLRADHKINVLDANFEEFLLISWFLFRDWLICRLLLTYRSSMTVRSIC